MRRYNLKINMQPRYKPNDNVISAWGEEFHSQLDLDIETLTERNENTD
jgi:hypothetical protein